MDLLEEMERQQKVVCEENLLLKTENELYRGEIARLTAILAARERVSTDDSFSGMMYHNARSTIPMYARAFILFTVLADPSYSCFAQPCFFVPGIA